MGSRGSVLSPNDGMTHNGINNPQNVAPQWAQLEEPNWRSMGLYVLPTIPHARPKGP